MLRYVTLLIEHASSLPNEISTSAVPLVNRQLLAIKHPTDLQDGCDNIPSMVEPISSLQHPTWNLSSPLPHIPDLDSDMQSIAPSALPSTLATTSTTVTRPNLIPSANLPTMMKKVLQYRRQFRKQRSQLPPTRPDINNDDDNSGVTLFKSTVHPSLVMTPGAIARLKSLGPQRLPPLPSISLANSNNSE